MTQSPRSGRSATFAQFFERQLALGEAAAFCLAGGATLFEAGEKSDQLLFLRTGRLAARLEDANISPRLILIHPGEPVGEMAVIAEAPHSTSVFALRDSELLAISRDAFIRAVQSESDLLIELSRLVLSRVLEPADDPMSSARRVFGFLGLSEGLSVRSLVDQIGGSLRSQGYETATLGSGDGPATPEFFANIESHHDFVLYAVEQGETAWRGQVRRQVDAVFNVASGRERPAKRRAGTENTPRAPNDDLILVQRPEAVAPRGSAAWVTALAPGRLFQFRLGHSGDSDRLARVISGQALGLVLSGGGARAYAHVGAVQALREIGAPIDFVGGVSMGAVIAAGIAMGWSDTELDQRIRAAFVTSNPVDDFTWPLVAITRGEKVRQRLSENFGQRTISDLWLPFFCVSTNLTTGAQQVHRQGAVRDVLRSSLSLPGLLPPVTVGEDVLVDGAILNNYPADIMRSFHSGPIVGVDVGRGRSIEAADVKGPTSILRWLASGGWRNGAPIVSVLMRAATVTAYHQVDAAHQVTDVLVQPRLDNVEIRDWKAYEPAVAEGRRAAAAAFAALNGRLTDLRRLAPKAE